eukprot:CAMPEP_0184651466 /NCGR_PEP_ID=MMETSP0308-20130426/9071_1 /TAXON_ID=38269 /ORGANISM="Gloeochaete witrockiana, Strain SAG 46.84" /LENGTH=292 /DNA_ID=CAMNT_0027085697 /DNA_START=377 /DNA_END=1255 /DNA_ORIENTATION=-
MRLSHVVDNSAPQSNSPGDTLVGYIYLDDLLLNPPSVRIASILHKDSIVIEASQKAYDFARKILNAGVATVPVVDEAKRFLGIITAIDAATLLDEQGQSEVLMLSGVSSVPNRSYFGTPFLTMLSQRLPWLAGLLVLQSVSGFILASYQELIQRHLAITLFLTMLIGTGGNTGNQSSALIVRGLATGELTDLHALKVLWREFRMSLVMGSILALIAFCRVLLTPQAVLLDACAIALSVLLIVISAMTLGSCLPLLLHRLSLDAANASAPALSTLMDVVGVLIVVFISSFVLG